MTVLVGELLGPSHASGSLGAPVKGSRDCETTFQNQMLEAEDFGVYLAGGGEADQRPGHGGQQEHVCLV